MARNDGGPAFPLVIEEEGCVTQFYRGMTMRQWYAGNLAAALVPMMPHHTPQDIARRAADLADALIEEVWK